MLIGGTPRRARRRHGPATPTRVKAVRAGVALALALGAALAAPQAASAAVSSSVSDEGELSVRSDAADAIAVTCTDGDVKVNGADPDGGAAPCASIKPTIAVDGGPGANAIDLSAVVPSQFDDLDAEAVTVDGNDGDDTITGSAFGDDLEGGKGADTELGGPGDDSLDWEDGDGSDVMEGGEGNDRVEVDGAPAEGDAFTVRPNGGRVRFDRTNLVPFKLDIAGTEHLVVRGRGGADSMVGAAGLKGLITLVFSGEGGNDRLTGGDGEDVLIGGRGQDVIRGGKGRDRLNGRGGNDRLVGGSGGDTLKGGGDSDRLNGQDGADRLDGGGGRDSFLGGGGNDRLNSEGERRERVDCGRGSDKVMGARGDRVKRNCERVRR